MVLLTILGLKQSQGSFLAPTLPRCSLGRIIQIGTNTQQTGLFSALQKNHFKTRWWWHERYGTLTRETLLSQETLTPQFIPVIVANKKKGKSLISMLS